MSRFNSSFRIMILACLTGLNGSGELCAASPKLEAANRDLVQGYALIKGVSSKNRNLDKLLMVKTTDNEVKMLIKEIAALFQEIDNFLEGHKVKGVAVKGASTGLPKMENEVRKSIEADKTRQLLFESGREFKENLLQSQVEGLTYTRHLLKITSKLEPALFARMKVRGFEKDCEVLLKRIDAMRK